MFRVSKFDLIVKRGIVIDGSGSPPFRADVGILGDSIRSIGDLSGSFAERVIDASDLIVAPGFIDILNHSDISVFELPTADNYVLQGVTTIVVGNCGSSPAPLTDINRHEYVSMLRSTRPDVAVTWSSFSEYLAALESLRPSINIAALVGNGTIRAAVLGYEDVRPSDRDIEVMRELVREAMEAGAFGISSGLRYVPSMFADKKEIVELAKVVAKYGGIYATHMRNQSLGLLDSIVESIEVGLDSGVSVQISHLKASGRASWGKTSKALALISDYASRGYDVSADAYPYEAYSMGLLALLPPEYRSGSREEVLKKLRNSDVVEKLRTEFATEIHWEDVQIACSPSNPRLEGMRVTRVAQELGVDPVEAVVKLLIDDNLATRIVGFTMNPEEVDEVISHPPVAIGSDGSITKFGVGKPHPRSYGTFPRVIARYVREKKTLSLPEAVRKMTSPPARKLGVWDKGLIRPGLKADIVVFDYYTIEDTATYTDPHRYPRGIKYVIVNGRVIVEDGVIDYKQREGAVLRKVRY
ncbi:MAG: D-aminoacylase [Sulfolobales archaeon]